MFKERRMNIKKISNKLWCNTRGGEWGLYVISDYKSIKITSNTINDEHWYTVYEEIIVEGFKRGFNYEISHARKMESYNYAWIVATSPEQTTNIRKNKITFGHENIDVSMDKLTGDDLAKKNTLILIAKNLNRLKLKEILKSEIRACMGEKNILNIYFKMIPKINSWVCAISNVWVSRYIKDS